MRRIIKDEEPEFWKNYKRKNKNVQYDDLGRLKGGFKIRMDMHDHLISHQLFVCAYCCKCITKENSHNEHIYPKSRYPRKSMEYDNLVVSCTSTGEEQTCGMKKENAFDEKLFVSPLEEQCESHFRFTPDGSIWGNSERGNYTVDLLNLNAYSLRKARECVYAQCMDALRMVGGRRYVETYYLHPYRGCLPRFTDMVEYFLQNEIFDDDIVDETNGH